jgi:surfeit locus 1 family protein
MSLFPALFSRRWILATLLVIGGIALCIRLGIWQLDRLEKRKAFNARVQIQLDASPLNLVNEALNADHYNLEYRQVHATGRYDFEHQIALRNQYYGNEWGVHLVTPLILEESGKVILVDRGWIPAADFESGDWTKFNEPGLVEVQGVLRRPQTKAEIGNRSDPTPLPGSAPLKAWYFINLEQIARQSPYPLMNAYIQQAPQVEWTGLPYRTQPELELSEGPHFGYALQWFTFAVLLGAGYPFFVLKQQNRLRSGSKKTAEQSRTYSGA